MALEKLLEDLIEALQENTAALKGGKSAAPAKGGKAEKPAKGKSKPSKDEDDEDEQEDEDEDEGDDEDADEDEDEDDRPAKKKSKKDEKPAKGKEGKKKKVTLDDVKKALRDYAELEGKPAAKAILKEHGDADTPAELEEENYQAVIDACSE